MKIAQLIAATLLLAAAGAYAGTDDGNVQGNGNPGVQTSAQTQSSANP